MSALTPVQWQRLSDLFAEVVERPAPERDTAIKALCPTGDPLRSELERLLAEHKETSQFLESSPARPAVAEKDDLPPGRLIGGRYLLESLIGNGGAGTVHLARDMRLSGKYVVLKFLHRWAESSEWISGKFRQEMQTLSRIRHPGVVTILDEGKTPEGRPYLVLEYVAGGSLRAQLKEGGLPLERVAPLLRQIGAALGAAHALPVIHRDLKPENILLDNPGTPAETVKLIDFGIAHVWEERSAITTGNTTYFAGTTRYMAPEQLLGKVRPESDIYGLGLIAYEMLTGRHAFDAASPVELYEMQKRGVRTPIRSLRSEVPLPAADLVLRALSFSAGQRPHSPQAFCDELAAELGRADRPVARISRRAAIVVVPVVAGAAVWKYLLDPGRPLPARERKVRFDPSQPPESQGFRFFVHGPFESNSIGGAWRIGATKEATYSHPLSDRQKRQAAQRGFTIRYRARVEKGYASVGLDLGGFGRRYEAELWLKADGSLLAGVPIIFSPKYDWRAAKVQLDAAVAHDVELTFNPRDGSSTMRVDGRNVLEKYFGYEQYQQDRGFLFGTQSYQTERCAVLFDYAELEIAG